VSGRGREAVPAVPVAPARTPAPAAQG